jgi:steroid delta-isomerase-like uncharacterized protein
MTKLERQRRQIEKLIDSLSAHRYDEAVNAFTGDTPAYEDVPSNLRLTGLSGITAAFETLSRALPDMEIAVVSELDEIGHSVREIIITGTHLGEYQGMEPTRQVIRFSGAAFFTFDSRGRLMTQRLYFDNESIRRQMRDREIPYLPDRLRLAA